MIVVGRLPTAYKALPYHYSRSGKYGSGHPEDEEPGADQIKIIYIWDVL
jgi:hypothetical protein